MSLKGACRFCSTPLQYTFCNLGMSPFSNAFLREEQLQEMEPFYPLHAWVCDNCLLVQVEEFESPETIFRSYAYFSSFSESWLMHAEQYVEEVAIRFQLSDHHQVIEIASNDGYLLQYFQKKGIPVLGIEPAANVAQVAIDKGIPTQVCFFGTDTATRLSAEGKMADLIAANNVLAHVPDLNDFVQGMKICLKPEGVITVEFPHLLELIRETQFDTIYHEHFSYFSLLSVCKVFSSHGLTVFDVEQLPTHGGSLRIFVSHENSTVHQPSENVSALLQREREAGLGGMACYEAFGEKVQQVRLSLLDFFLQARRRGKSIAAYGAAAKGNTLLNYCGIGSDLVDFVVDRNTYKQGLYLPGTHIPVLSPDVVKEARPDYLLILPWNLREEIIEQMSEIRTWGGQFVIPVPETEVLP